MGTRRERKAEKMESMGRKKREWWAGGGYENAAQKRIREATEGVDDGSLDFQAILYEQDRKEILTTKIQEYTRKGYQLQTNSGTSASLVSPAASPMGIGGFVLGICTLGLSWLFMPARRGKDNDRTLHVDVGRNGLISVTSNGMFGDSQDNRFVPRVEGE